ncbi:hypothetical protein QWE_23574 [Agrobacterium albertimagni AOL15]|uniref:Uncharacterized protein n=1 Tax=Agrobacterium albertimagni AOL15 TaxID=1156935 RepID=K2PWC6_9HYPH|nr:hypothetical protein QWE_23574 [Agrobacterium albertimagni AOL15]
MGYKDNARGELIIARLFRRSRPEVVCTSASLFVETIEGASKDGGVRSRGLAIDDLREFAARQNCNQLVSVANAAFEKVDEYLCVLLGLRRPIFVATNITHILENPLQQGQIPRTERSIQFSGGFTIIDRRNPGGMNLACFISRSAFVVFPNVALMTRLTAFRS